MTPWRAWRPDGLAFLRPVAWLAAVLLAVTVLLLATGDDAFGRFLGGVHPVLALASATLLCAGTLAYLHRRFGFAVSGPDRGGGLAVAAGLALAMAVLMVGLDLMVPLPRDLNIPFPASLLFYPVIGFVAETAFHLVPLALLLAVLAPLGREEGRVVWPAILLVALVEPIYQTLLAGPGTPTWQTGYIAVHVYIISLLQLWVFRRYDFLSMYFFRLAYYLVWHVVWGHIRLTALF